ncbi:hypothetical protein S7711_07649 [Stachybotrys chartarum IBT 7711]|uniref:Small ribosomal subunit protein uS9m n=1 Tax=Stachybotrys chartarum (strain CBS 109288 / IBT 7711) TaxID=1280523 RepID=A0A084ALL3_STACB|nr:hypothetical protein S7711_07649 [Stachybotrys chartarum IBT 7711]KFA47036.1 hypothetical protein S40293_04644 [Stachybotrys chartarum IBT 40293]KFA75451.1 hypothetical protein S40288_01197 [Stachybotrys chartarum IBT 40288]
MKAVASGLRPVACQAQLVKTKWQHSATLRTGLPIAIRTLTTNTTTPNMVTQHSAIEKLKIPFQGIQHARAVPATPSYFSKEPRFNDLYIQVSKLLTKYHHLPTVLPSEAPQLPWSRLETIRSELGESVKASHYAKVIRVAKRLNLIEPSLRPPEITMALEGFVRSIDPSTNQAAPITIDKFGRAVGVGKRKASRARAFVVEGTGEILVNGKTLSEVFGRVHDRESAVWALMVTDRIDKYNIWALVEGGGTTGQAEALTLAVAKGLLAHEPALKPALRKAGCITRDIRTVERKKHGRVKARKSPAWVKR